MFQSAGHNSNYWLHPLLYTPAFVLHPILQLEIRPCQLFSMFKMTTHASWNIHRITNISLFVLFCRTQLHMFWMQGCGFQRNSMLSLVQDDRPISQYYSVIYPVCLRFILAIYRLYCSEAPVYGHSAYISADMTTHADRSYDRSACVVIAAF